MKYTKISYRGRACIVYLERHFPYRFKPGRIYIVGKTVLKALDENDYVVLG